MKSDEITVKEFATIHKMNLNDFYAHWVTKQIWHPTEYRSEMSYDEWIDRYIKYLEQLGKL